MLGRRPQPSAVSATLVYTQDLFPETEMATDISPRDSPEKTTKEKWTRDCPAETS